MSDNTKIEWTDATWNPITGCSVVSAGCKHCYAMKLAGTRLQHHPSRAGLTVDTKNGPVWTGEVRLNEQWLDQPLRWKRPRMIFVCAHADLFHESVPDDWIDLVFSAMELSPQHIFQVLTKRAGRMRDYINSRAWKDYPLPNVWLGVSVEDQDAADERIPLLLDTPAAVRWVSAEPLLGPVDASRYMWPVHARWPAKYKSPDEAKAAGEKVTYHRQGLVGAWRRFIDWVVVGGESGPKARPMHPDWARSLRDQCAEAGVPLLFKQFGEWAPETAVTDDGSPFADSFRRNSECHICDGGERVFRVGKKRAGRLLDGVQHDGYPGVNQ